MNDIAYNLITITGNKAELERFEKTAYKNENEVFCLECLLPIPDYYSEERKPSRGKYAFIGQVHSCTQRETFSILVEKSEEHLKYFFNAIDRSTDINRKFSIHYLNHLSIKYPNLNFSLVFLVLDYNSFGVQEYKCGKPIDSFSLEWKKFDFEIPSKVGTYLHLEDLGKKIQTLLYVDLEVDDDIYNSPDFRIKFFDYINRQDFLRKHQDFYENLILKEIELINSNFYHARFKCKFSFITNSADYLKRFIEENILEQSKKEFLFNEISLINDNINQDRAWWNNLSNRWTDEFVRNLMNNVKGLKNKTPEQVLDYIESTDKGLDQLLRLKQLHVKVDLIADLSPVLYLKNLKDFKIIEPEYLITDYLESVYKL